MKMAKFTCEKSGRCCQNLRNGRGFGLMLFDWEALGFLNDGDRLLGRQPALQHIIRADPKTRTRVILMNQLAEDKCPFLDEENKCRVYPTRPLVCRGYPVQSTGLDPAHPTKVSVGRECSGCKTCGILRAVPAPKNNTQAYAAAKILYETFGDSFVHQFMVEQNNNLDYLLLNQLKAMGHFGVTKEETKSWPLISFGNLCKKSGLSHKYLRPEDLESVKKELMGKI